MDKLKYMKMKLMDAIEKEIDGNLEYANTQELGEAVDMVKDLSEAIYYCTITEAMEDKGEYKRASNYPSERYYGDRMLPRHDYKGDYYEDRYEEYPMMYYGGNGNMGGGTRYYDGTSTRYMMYNHDYPMLPQGGDRSSMSRKRYMDAKMHSDKNTQMKELEMYTQELANDLTDMIKDASPEEKQLLQQKISLLAQKIK